MFFHYLPHLDRVYYCEEGKPPTIRSDIKSPSVSEQSIKVPSMISAVRCLGCGAVLSRENQKIRELPSRDWMELLDCWSCHNGEFSSVTNNLTLSAQGEILPREGEAHYGGFWLMINANEWNLKIEEDVIIHCSSCNTPVGHFVGEKSAKIEVDKLDNFLAKDESMMSHVLMREVEQIIELHGGRLIRFIDSSSNSILVQIMSHKTWLSKDLVAWRQALVLHVVGEDDVGVDAHTIPTIQLPDNIFSRLITAIEDGKQEARIAAYPPPYSIVTHI